MGKQQKILKKVRIYSEFAASVFHQLGFDVRISEEQGCFYVFYEPIC